MPVIVPPAVNYQSPQVAVPIKVGQEPTEGRKLINYEVTWASMGGASNCVAINLSNNAALNFSQIIAISIDNSACGGDVQFAFPDTEETTVIPAYTPKTIIEVFTNATQFYLIGEGVATEDITRFSILNFLPPPISVPTTEEQNTASVSPIVITTPTSGSTQIIATNVNGTLEAAYVYAQLSAPTGNNCNLSWTLQDGTGKVIAQGVDDRGAGSNPVDVLFDGNPLRVRFSGGVVFNWTASGQGGGNAYVNLYYRTP
jgi:hypothetical protein